MKVRKKYTLLLFSFIMIQSVLIEAKTTPDFSNQMNHYSGKRIKKFALMGLRCSGTNYIYHLIKENYPKYVFYSPTNMKYVPHKHHWPYTDEENSALYKNEDCLFILVVRNPYAWLQSLYGHSDLVPHQNRESFSKFIRSRWKYNHDCLPEKDHKLFRNILYSRSFENRNFLRIGKKVPNFIVVNYEKVASSPRQFIQFLSKEYRIECSNDFKNIVKERGQGPKYVPKKYDTIKLKDLILINKTLDWNLENALGYKRKLN